MVAGVLLGLLAGPEMLGAPARAGASRQARSCQWIHEQSFRGMRLSEGLFLLTGAHLQPGREEPCLEELADPAPPLVTERGEVEIYGSGRYFLRYASWSEFERGGAYRIVPLDLRYPGGESYTGTYTHPWDLRKYRVEAPGEPGREVLVGGAMSATEGRAAARWPEDNINRRIFLFHRDATDRWIRARTPLVGEVASGWLGHSYGGNFFQPGAAHPGVLRPGATGDILFFYEKVDEVGPMGDGTPGPFRTQIYARRVAAGSLATTGPEVRIIGVGEPPYPATRRSIGGYLVEGPRPIELRIAGRTLYLVTFSSGDFPTDGYAMNYAWATRPLGPYHPVLDRSGTDLVDLGAELKQRHGLSWVGRPVIYRTRPGQYEMLFHAVRRNLLPDNDYRRWPTRYPLWRFFRSIFKVRLRIQLAPDGAPLISLDLDTPPSPGRTGQ
jgi:hypothetical protein